MSAFLNKLMIMIAGIHDTFLSFNDRNNFLLTDKELHFVVIGLFGIALLCIVHPLFMYLAKKDHIMVASFLYVFSAVIVITFAIEIGQRVSGTGTMELWDITYGIAGFLVMFAVFIAVRGIVRYVRKKLTGKK